MTLTPETSIQLQKKLGADIIIPFDELPPFHCSPEALQKSFQRTHRWQKRSLETHRKNPKNQAIYGVVHGGVNADLRAKSCKRLSNMGFDGYAIGGSLGKNREDLLQVLAYCMPNLAGSSVKHLLGIADIPSIEAGVPFGIDTFDSCYPTRAARHGVVIVGADKIKLTSGRYKNDFTPIDPECACWTCQHYTKAYLHHLFKANEPAALTLASIHNIAAMMRKMEQIRAAILRNEI